MRNNFFSLRTKILFLLSLLFCIASVVTAETPSSTKKIRIALYLDKGAHPRTHLIDALETAPDMTLTVMTGEELREGRLNHIDLLIVPGGSSIKESSSMEAEGRQEVRTFVSKGGLYMGICAGCYLLTEAKPSDLGLLPLNTLDKKHWRRGKGMLSVELTAMGMEVFGTTQKTLEILYHNGPVIDAAHVTPEVSFTPLGYFRSELVEKEGTKGIMKDSPAMFYGKFGKGLVLGISPHPEAHKNQVDMELNAIRWLYTHHSSK